MPIDVWVYHFNRIDSRDASLNAAHGPGWQSTVSTAPVWPRVTASSVQYAADPRAAMKLSWPLCIDSAVQLPPISGSVDMHPIVLYRVSGYTQVSESLVHMNSILFA